jgi:integrase
MNFQLSPNCPELTNPLLADLIERLPKLPPIIRYYDDFDEKICSIAVPESALAFELAINGRIVRIDFAQYTPDYAQLLKQVFVLLLGENLTVSTAVNYIGGAPYLDTESVAAILGAGPTGIALEWMKLRAREMPVATYILVKCFLRLLCRHRLHGWSNSYDDYVGTALPLPFRDAYAGVRSGDVFLSAHEESAIVAHLDEVAMKLGSVHKRDISDDVIADAAMLVCAYQFAMRPIQIAKLGIRNVRIWHEDSAQLPTVHLTFYMAKQRSESKRKPLTRRVKSEWTPIFHSLFLRRKDANLPADCRYFPIHSNHEVTNRIASLVRMLLGTDDLGTSTDLRHTAAQRLVDAGASHEELAEFMGHSHLRTGLIYYETSATHAERVNRALGASDLYRRVVRMAHDRFISSDELAHLKDEQQIAAVPHGIPIAGIGGCSSGQPACPYNPITSCYGCRKFMPVHEKAVHERVLAAMRQTVLLFHRSSRGDSASPAYLQLQRTISEIQSVVEEIEEGAK